MDPKNTPRPKPENPEESNQPGNLKYNEDADSYELDVKSEDPDYDHPDPYETAAPNGEDDNSDWDEANLYVGNEYDKNLSLENDADKLGMHVIDDSELKVDAEDEKLAQTHEDERDDLDEEGYPKNDAEIGGDDSEIAGEQEEFLK